MRFMVIVKANKDSEAGFGAEFTPELREQEERQRAQMAEEAKR